MHMLLHQSRQKAVIAALVPLDKFQKDNPGGVDCILAQRALYVCAPGLLVDEGCKVVAQPAYGLAVALLGCFDQILELRGRVGELFLGCGFYVVQILSVAAYLCRV